MNRKQFISTLGVGAAGLMTFGCKNGMASTKALPTFSMENPDPFWAAVRNEFPLTRERTYMNNGGLGPASSRVLNAVQAKAQELQEISETGHEVMEETREIAAGFFGADADEVCFTRSATEGNSIVAAGLKLKEGDEVIFESHAHPGGGMAWMNRQKRHGIKVKIFDPDPNSIEGNINRIEALITDKTRAIQLSHVTAPTGILFDVKTIAKLARERDIWFHIDGAQSAGMFPFNLHEIGCHSYATSGHKWMGGPRGTGILYIAKDDIDGVECSHAGSYSGPYDFPDTFTYAPRAQRHEYGTRNTEIIEGLAVAMQFQQSIGMERIGAYGQKLATYLQKGLREIDGVDVLTPIDPRMYRSISTFKCEKMDFHDLYRALSDDYHFRCRIVSERGLDAVRISTHLYNSKSDCDRVVESVQEILQKA